MSKPIQLVRFPPPTHLYTLKTGSGYSFFHAEDLETWLATIVMKHVEANRVFAVHTAPSHSSSSVSVPSTGPVPLTPLVAEEQRRLYGSISSFPKYTA
jgi:hypothetical protein